LENRTGSKPFEVIRELEIRMPKRLSRRNHRLGPNKNNGRCHREYEQKFGRIFIVCATGKSAGEILEILRRRLHNDEAAELQQAAEEQRQIVHIRLKKWIAG